MHLSQAYSPSSRDIPPRELPSASWEISTTRSSTARNVTVYPELEAALGNAFSVGTASVLDVDGELLIDHIATTSEIQFQLVRTISRKRISGQHVSDHPGVIGCLIVESRQTSDIEFESDAEEDVGFPFHKDDVKLPKLRSCSLAVVYAPPPSRLLK